MPMIWKTITIPIEESEYGCGTWEPFAVVEDEGVPLVVCKGMFDTADEDQKSTESSGPLHKDW